MERRHEGLRLLEWEESDWTSLLIVRTFRMDHLLDPIVRDLVRCERIPSLADVT